MARKTRKASPSRKPRLSSPLPPNAAELWAATLPSASEIAIVTERARRDSRPVAPMACRDSHPDHDVRFESERGWALASLALMVLVVVLACCAAGVRLH